MDTLTLARLAGISSVDVGYLEIAFRLSLAFLLGSTIAVTYRQTHKTFAFSYSMQVGIVLISIIVAMVLMVVDNSLARAFGLVGALAIIRFRTPVKDIRDIVFLFLAVGNGIACGAGAFKIALLGTLSANVISLIMYSPKFNLKQNAEDLLIRVSISNEHFDAENAPVDRLLEQYCYSFALIELNASADAPYDAIYSIRLGSEKDIAPIVKELSGMPGILSASVLSSMHNMDFQ